MTCITSPSASDARHVVTSRRITVSIGAPRSAPRLIWATISVLVTTPVIAPSRQTTTRSVSGRAIRLAASLSEAPASTMARRSEARDSICSTNIVTPRDFRAARQVRGSDSMLSPCHNVGILGMCGEKMTHEGAFQHRLAAGPAQKLESALCQPRRNSLPGIFRGYLRVGQDKLAVIVDGVIGQRHRIALDRQLKAAQCGIFPDVSVHGGRS